MITENGTMKTSAKFSDDREYRFLLRKEWDDTKPKAVVIMTNPSMADMIALDFTTLYIINNLSLLGFGGVDIVNIIPKITTKINVKEDSEITDEAYEENMKQIKESAEKSDKTIIAWGQIGESNKKIQVIQDDVLDNLAPFWDKMCYVSDRNGKKGFHPLAPQIRFEWKLVKFHTEQEQTPIEEVKPTKTNKSKKSQKAETPTPEEVTEKENE